MPASAIAGPLGDLSSAVGCADKKLAQLRRGHAIMSTVEEIDFDALRLEQQRRGEFETRRDFWLTAAVMTALLVPIGSLFGIAALVVAKGSRAAIDKTDWTTVGTKLGLCRVLVVVGTILGVALLLYQGASGFALVFSRPEFGSMR